MSSFLMSLGAFIAVLSPLVFIHELGHYLAAKACGVHVERFSIGFGPKIFSWKDKSGTEWIFSWILLGGYVQMLGDGNVASSVSQHVAAIDHSRTMAGKTHMQRIGIAFAGPAVNYLLAFVLFVALFVHVGKPYHKTIVGVIAEESLSYKAGLRKNDRIQRVQDRSVKTFEDALKVVAHIPATNALDLEIKRHNDVQTITLQPAAQASGFWLGKLKIGPEKNTRFYVPQSWGAAISDTLDMMNPVRMIKGLKLESMGGPIAIAHQAGNVIQEGWVPVLFLMAALSLGLGFFNLLPLPVLDGGLIAMELLELVLRRPLSAKVRQNITIGTFGLLALLFAYLSWGDLMRIPLISGLVKKIV
jgi:regulator of sigma E protease